ncbi:hypothetical protein [Propionivibrio dicarboxylicus]|nr:hypothetical protein [Propionivibrio dicarboxylicus]
MLKSCSRHNAQPVSSVPQIDESLLGNLGPGDSVYVCTDALKNFADNFLSQIHSPFVLLSGDSDQPISEAFLSDPSLRSLLDDPRLIGWYAQNLATTHDKLHPLPIGLDYHTMWERPGFWGITAISPVAQENALINILAQSPEFNRRYMTAYCNWHFALHRGDRQECFEKSDKTSCFFEPNAIPRHSSWMRQAECMFVASPEGAGMDCHRTWEALCLGCIPIVKRNPLAPLFADLPVLIIDDWSLLNRDTMQAYASETYAKKFDFSTLFRTYWNETVAGKTPLRIPPMTFGEFRNFLTRRTG